MNTRSWAFVALTLATVACTAGAAPGPFRQDERVHEQIKKLSSDDFEEQGRAAKALEEMGREAVPHLKKLRDDLAASGDLRAWCRKILEKIDARDKRFRELGERLASADDEVKEAAEMELRQIGRPAVPHLLAWMMSTDKNLRLRAEKILKSIGSEDEVRAWREEGRAPASRGDRGIFGGRFGGRENLAARGGGTRATESAVLASLKWLARHQNADGSWSAADFTNQCVGAKCVGAGDSGYDAGLTGLSVLAFLGAGYSHLSKDEYPDPVTVGKTLKFGEVVKNALKWLLSKQDPEGCIGGRGTKYMYNHSIATLAITEAYGMSATQLFKGPAQQAVDFIVASQNSDKGWRYTKRSGDTDTSVTGWAIQALKSAELSELTVPTREAYGMAEKWLNEVTDSTIYYRVGYNGKSSGKVFVPGKNERYHHHETMTSIGVLSRILMFKNKKEPALGGVQLLVKDLPEWKEESVDFYYWYFTTNALFQYDGPDGPYWKKWIGPLKNTLVPNQKAATDGCANGSWNSEDDRWGFEGGRVYAVALNALTLETFYRYPRELLTR